MNTKDDNIILITFFSQMAACSSGREDGLPVLGPGGLHQLLDDQPRPDHATALHRLQLQDLGPQQRGKIQAEPELLSGNHSSRK